MMNSNALALKPNVILIWWRDKFCNN